MSASRDTAPTLAGYGCGMRRVLLVLALLVTTGRYGFRIYDVRDASRPRLLDTYQPPEILGESTAWRGNLIYLFDMDRGIEILRLKGGPHAAAKLATVREPKARVDKLAKVPVSGLTRGSLVCPLFVAQPQ